MAVQHRRFLSHSFRRLANAARKVASGLRLRGENVSPEVPNDLFQAHLSIYLFFGRFVEGRRVLDLGCGAGYGSDHLVRQGAREVVGIDVDPRNVRYARRRYAGPRLCFRVADAQRLPDDLGVFDVVVSSNVFEHLVDVEAALEGVRLRLSGDGVFIVVVPPITDSFTLEANRRIPYHRTNLYVWDWAALLRGRFEAVRAFRHLPPPGREPDFLDPFPSKLAAGDFEFVEVPVSELGKEATLGAVFHCSRRNAP